MATPAQNLQTAYDNLCAAYASATANPKPTYSEGGRSISWESYLRMLGDQIDAMGKRLATATPTEVVTLVRP